MSDSNCGERLTGHGAEWNNANLSPEDARAATAWVEARVDKRSMLTDKDRVEDVPAILDALAFQTAFWALFLEPRHTEIH